MSLYNADTEALIEQQMLKAARATRPQRQPATGTNGTMLTYSEGERPYGPIRPVYPYLGKTNAQKQAEYQQSLTTWRVREIKRTRQHSAAGKAS